MFEGIEILNKTEISQWVWRIPIWLLVVGTLVIILGVGILGCKLSVDYDCAQIGALLSALLMVILCGLFYYSTGYTEKIGRYEYQVTISDDVNFNEFINKYEIVKQDGKIYTIVERE